ncbi:baseplate megatron protein TIM-barrel domain-containing protein [Rhodovulum bhavnagarense]|uniref:phage tail protein n=1 Tax=Rhodovulum bhavnagarense TaxID=992286 RepID=UPI003C7BF014
MGPGLDGESLYVIASEILDLDAQQTAWQPQSKPIWFTELGCPAIDKGTNAPNLFFDPKSSESAFPPFSSGARDDLIQQQYLRAVLEYWKSSDTNPVSKVYGGPMLDLSRAHVWTWDARPFPQFPSNDALWSDGANYGRGHWLNGRATAQPLEAVIAEICHAAGVIDLDLDGVHGLVRGYTLSQITSARSALQSLMLAHGLEAAERDGKIVFFNRDGRASCRVSPAALAITDRETAAIEHCRGPEAETAGRVRLTFVESEGAYEARAVEAILPDEAGGAVASTEMTLVLTRGEAQSIVARWLAEARIARDRVRLALPPSSQRIGAGDVIRLEEGDFRIDRVDQCVARQIEAVRVERGVYGGAAMTDEEEGVAQPAFVAPMPVAPVFLDLPLLSGQEVPHAPHIAIIAHPWPGTAAVYSAVEDAGYKLNTLVGRPTVAGVTETPLFAAAPSRWDRGPALRVRLSSGTLSSVSRASLFAGANAAAIGNGASGRWEVFQFAEAELVAPRTYELRGRLRGQVGSEGEIGSDHPAGSYFVLLDGTPVQIELTPDALGLARHYRIGPGGRPLDDPSYVHVVEAFEGIGLRPYAPCHLRVDQAEDGELTVSWVRRTRIGGDSWALADVPLGEANERYHLRVLDAQGKILRETTLQSPGWVYSAAMRAADESPFAIEVAQLSERFGPGPYRRIDIHG